MKQDLRFTRKETQKIVVVEQTFLNKWHKLANIDIAKNKVNLSSPYKRYLEKKGENLKEVCETILAEFYRWEKSQSPLRNMTADQVRELISKLNNIDVLAICFQDAIDALPYIDELDTFNEVKGDLAEILESILAFTKKTSDIVGIDKTIENGDKADLINEILNAENEENED